jgi:hypothetical protein
MSIIPADATDPATVVSVRIDCRICSWVAIQHFPRQPDGRMPDLAYDLERGDSILWDWDTHAERRHKNPDLLPDRGPQGDAAL